MPRLLPSAALLLLLAAFFPATFATPTAPVLGAPEPTGTELEESALGWAGPDLARARELARASQQPILILIRRAACPECDRVWSLLTRDTVMVPLTAPFIRMLISVESPEGRQTSRGLRVTSYPTVLLLGPGGMEAIRSKGTVERRWLLLQLQVLARRHQRHETPADPEPGAIARSLERLEAFGDLEGAAQLRPRAAAARGPVVIQAAPLPKMESEADLATLLADERQPARIREIAFRLALDLESRGQASLGVAVLRHAAARLGIDPVTEARAAFLALRHGLDAEGSRARLMKVSRLSPSSLPLLLALCRAAEATDHPVQAFHSAEDAAVVAPDDAWVAMELRRLRLLMVIRDDKLSQET